MRGGFTLYFVERDAFRTSNYYLQQKKPGRCLQPTPSQGSSQVQRKVFASAVSRYVFKQGRKTFPPEKMLFEYGLLPSRDSDSALESEHAGKEVRFEDAVDNKRPTWRSIEERRKRDLAVAQLKLGWDAVHDAFEGDVSMALGGYTDLL